MESKPLKILMLGGAWADLIYQEYLSNQHQGLYLPFHLARPDFCPSPDVVESLGGTEQDLQILRMVTKQSSVLVQKLTWYCDKADVCLVDTDQLNTAIGHEILRNAKDYQVPAYGVGVNSLTSPLCAVYLRGIIYPRTTQDIYGTIEQYREVEAKPEPPLEKFEIEVEEPGMCFNK